MNELSVLKHGADPVFGRVLTSDDGVELCIDGWRGNFLGGWCRWPAGAAAPGRVSVWSGGRELAATVAAAQRGDVGTPAGAAPAFGFSLFVPPGPPTGAAPSHVTVKVDAAGAPSPAHAVGIAWPRAGADGHVDGVTGEGITGWCVDHDAGGHGAGGRGGAVDIAVDGVFWATVSPTLDRPDAAALVQAQDTRLGFRVTPPVWLADGRPHRVTVTARATGMPLTAEPFDLTVPTERAEDFLVWYAGKSVWQHRYRRPAAGVADGTEAGVLDLDLMRHAVFTASRTAPDPLILARLRDRLERLNAGGGACALSIVVPVHGGWFFLNVALASLLGARLPRGTEVIVVDDASPDTAGLDMGGLNAGGGPLRIVRLAENQGFAGAVNAGVARAAGTDVYLMNSDAVVFSESIDLLRHALQTDLSIGVAGSMLVNPDGHLEEAGAILWRNAVPSQYVGSGDDTDPQVRVQRSADYVSAASMLVRRALFAQLGGLDTAYGRGYFEDTDFCQRVWDAGRRVAYCGHSVTGHWKSVSYAAAVSHAGRDALMKANQALFVARHGHKFRNRAPYQALPHLHRDPTRDRRVLFIDAEYPRLGSDAGSNAALNEIELFRRLGFHVILTALNPSIPLEMRNHLERRGIECPTQPHFPSWREVVDAYADVDVVMTTRHGVFTHVHDRVRERHGPVKMLLNLADLHFLRALREAEVLGSPQAQEAAQAEQRAELRAAAMADAVFTYSDVEARVLAKLAPQALVRRMPWVTEPAAAARGSDGRVFGFLGNFRHPPNRDAARHLCADLWPRIHARVPDATLIIAGHRARQAEAFAAGAAGVRIEEDVDLADFFRRTRVLLAPLRFGAGVKGKVFDAWAHRVVAVLSPIAAEGMVLSPLLRTLVAGGHDDFADIAARVMLDPELWDAATAEQERVLRAHHGWPAAQAALRDALEGIGIACGGSPS
ncbi:glycosyltransferase [Azospirillum sp.]|uniref:glycosyltransferase n=1 Tax=Azospirillum sp. TaxID=34012 RepID=UPI002D3B7F70|nr:glycosyltransferase [Azospirillum sp.]HYD66709.1 glycosyltransferase [Azospirillum sp.]